MSVFEDGPIRAYTCAHCGATSALSLVSLWAQDPDDEGMRGTAWYSSSCAACDGESHLGARRSFLPDALAGKRSRDQ